MHNAENAASSPTEAGQGAFAAIAEIVALLDADPKTDWSKVDIAALREHLVDMNELILNAVAQEEPIPGGLRITVTGEGRTLRAIRDMVPTHAAELAKIEGWQVEAAAQKGRDAQGDERGSAAGDAYSWPRLLRSDGDRSAPSGAPLGDRDRTAGA